MGNPQPLFERVAVNNSMAGRVNQSKKPYLTNKIAGQMQAYNLNPAVESLLIIPLLVNNEAIGVLDVVNKAGGFSNEDIRVLGSLHLIELTVSTRTYTDNIETIAKLLSKGCKVSIKE